MEEVWRPIKGYETLYEVSNLGNVRSLGRTIQGVRRGTQCFVTYKAKILKPALNSCGYYTVSLRKDNKSKTHKVHCLVAQAFIGERPQNHEVCHGEKGKLNNEVSNLSYGTRIQNERDKIRDNTSNHRLTSAEVVEIKKLYYEESWGIIKLSKLFNIAEKSIWKILKGISYKHVV